MTDPMEIVGALTAERGAAGLRSRFDKKAFVDNVTERFQTTARFGEALDWLRKDRKRWNDVLRYDDSVIASEGGTDRIGAALDEIEAIEVRGGSTGNAKVDFALLEDGLVETLDTKGARELVRDARQELGDKDAGRALGILVSRTDLLNEMFEGKLPATTETLSGLLFAQKEAQTHE